MGLKIDDLNITHEQKLRLKKLEKFTTRNAIGLGLKNVTLLLVMMGLVFYFNIKYINSKYFLDGLSFLNGIMFYVLFRLDFLKEKDRIKREISKIFEVKE